MTAPGMGGVGRRMMHQDSSLANKKLAPGTIRRVVSFARPYRKELTIFLGLTIVSSVIGFRILSRAVRPTIMSFNSTSTVSPL